MKASHHPLQEQQRRYYERTLEGFSAANRDSFRPWLKHLEAKRP